MKRIQIINMFRTLGRIKLNKIGDRKLRNTLIDNHLKMFRVARENDDYIASLRERFDPEAVDQVNEAYQRYADGEVDIEFGRIGREAFADVIAKGDVEFTLADFGMLEPLFNDQDGEDGHGTQGNQE